MIVALARTISPAFAKRLLTREVAVCSCAQMSRVPRSWEDVPMLHYCRGVLFAGFAALAIAILGAATPATAQAQDAVLRGKVTSDRGEAVSGANVVVEELRLGVTTNATGDFTITVPAARVRGQQIVVRARGIGFKPGSKAVTLTPG